MVWSQPPPSPTSHDQPVGSAPAGPVRAERDGRVWAPALLVGAAGALMLAGLAFIHRAAPGTAMAGAAVLILLAAVLAWRGRAASGARPHHGARTLSDGPVHAQPPDAQNPYVLALELGPDPVMLVSGGEPDDLAGRRVAFANAAARELLRIPEAGALLVAVVRHPDMLEAIDEALFAGLNRTIRYETSGPPDRFWRVWTKPLPAASETERLALVVMRDETDEWLNERMRADFLANASHELRTPLASLTGFIETLRGHARDDTQARERFLLIMSRQAERMSRLIDDLMSLSRIELNEHIRPSGLCDLALAVADVADALAPQIAQKRLRLDLRAPERGEALVIGDRDQIVQVIQNLLDNAVKYAPEGEAVAVEVTHALPLEQAGGSRPDSPRLKGASGGRMSLLTPPWTGTQRFCAVQVVDTGPGLAREHLPRLSERFYRVESGKKGERSGTGLGLAIVKHIMNRHRGGLFVESAPGVGAAFTVYFPAAQGVDPAGALSSDPDSQAPRSLAPET